MEFYFSACLSAAKSVFYILAKTGGRTFKAIEHKWRPSLTDDPARARFNRMMRFRDDDVHLGATGAVPQPKYIEEDWYGKAPHHSSGVFYSAALFGPAPAAEQMNPDGTTVRGGILRGTVGIYLDQDGRTIEATTACREFIEQLRSLLDAMKT